MGGMQVRKVKEILPEGILRFQTHFRPGCLQVRGRMPKTIQLFGSNYRRLLARAKRVRLVLDVPAEPWCSWPRG